MTTVTTRHTLLDQPATSATRAGLRLAVVAAVCLALLTGFVASLASTPVPEPDQVAGATARCTEPAC